jgi:amino acid adenylation domain-containing protein
MLADGGVEVLVCEAGQAARWSGKVREVVVPAEAEAEEEEAGGEAEEPLIEGEQLAYVIYTSGSTGRPKGVAVQHASLANLVRWHQQTYEVKPTDRATLLAGLAFDAAVWELWPYLTAGASLYIPAEEETRISPPHLRRWLVENEINLSFVTTPLAEQLITGEWPAAGNSLRALLTGGDRLTRHPAPSFGVPLVNHYGPTECTVVATAGRVPAAGAEEGLPSIGRPIANTRIYILDRSMRPVPVGVTGELYVGGAGVARGYWGRPALTAAFFVPDPFSSSPGARMYRTGDLARYGAGGEVEYVGRADRQVKVRGQRIEPAEVERVLEEREGVAAAAVVLRREEDGDARLVAYVVREPAGGTGDGAVSWADYVRGRLPEAMRPWVVREVESLPLTPNGKVDREELGRWAAAEQRSEAEAGAARPRTALEEVLAGIWEEVLGVAGVGVHDDFFDLGGHSLLATQAVSRVAQAVGAELPVRALFEAPTVAALAERINQARAGGRPAPQPIVAAADRGGSLPVSFAQHRLWFLELFQPGSSLFHMPAALRLEGRLDTGALRESLNLALRRHEILSAKFAVEDGQPVMLLPPSPLELSLPVVELGDLSPAEQEAEVRRLSAEEARAGFDLMQGPLIRARLLRLGVESHVLLITVHHIVTDGWSMNVLTKEVGEAYAALVAGREPALPPLPIQYADYAAWQREAMRGDFLEHLLGYWRERLGGEPPVLDLPLDFTRPTVQTFNGARAPMEIGAGLTREMQGLGRRTGTTLYMILLGAWQALLHRYTGQADILTGTLIANRHRLETESVIGCLINALPIRADLSADPSFEHLLEQTRRVSLEAYEHQDLPFEMLVEDLQLERDLSRPPLIQVMFGFQNFGLQELQLPGVLLTPLPVETDAVAYELTLTLAEKDGRVVGALEYNTDLFTRATAERMAGHFLTLLEAAVRDPSQQVSRLPLLTEAERVQLLRDWNQTAQGYPLESCFHQLFERQAAATPDAVAVRTDESRLTYAELNRVADRAARALRAQGVGADEVVILLAERGAEFLTAVLAIFKAGGAYLPLDPRYPAQRLAQIMGRSGSRLALAGRALAPQLEAALLAMPEEARPQTLVLEDLQGGEETAVNPPPPSGPRNLAYVLFTSGSTGVPKGAMIEQRGMVNHLYAKISDVGLTAEDIVAQNASQCFDISVWQFLSPLLVGGSVRVVSDEVRHDPLGLLSLVEREGVTVLEVVPSLLQAMLEEVSSSRRPPRLASLRWLVVTGEALPPPLARRWHELYPDVPLLNAYGPTECSDDVTHHALSAAPDEQLTEVPIGRPVANTRLYVLDRRLQPVPVGVPGELYVGGAGVGRGYLGAPGRTAEVFIPDPFGGEPGAVLYKTGDLVSYLPGGELRFLGRVDHQVKVRGFRIELGEIETVLRQHPLIAEAAVLDHANEEGEKVLTAYVVARQQPAPDTHDAAWTDERVQQWQDVFDGVYSQTGELADGSLNLSGWISSYTGEPIPEEEMRSWVEGTVENLLALRPQRVLEIGCGAGLLLLRVAPHCRRYWGTDFAPQSLRYLREQLAHHEMRGAEINLLQRPADDFSGLAPDSFDAVVLNSVAQYFPGVDYLLSVLKGAVEVVAPGGFIYVGDIRNRRLLEAFHLSVQARKVEPEMTREEFAAHVRRLMNQEDELLLDPEFFFALKDISPKIGHVEIRPKRGRHHNELTRFRYDVVLRVGEVERPATSPTPLDWREAGLTVLELERRLAAERPEAVWLMNLPNARLAEEARGLRWLHGAGEQPQSVGEWLRAEAGEHQPLVEPEDLLALAARTPYEVALSCARTGPEGSFEAALARRDAGPGGADGGAAPSGGRAALLLPEPPRQPPASWGRYANNPLQGVITSKLLPQLRGFIAERLPEYMIPATFVALESLPLTANGKIDRRALLKPHASQLAPATLHVAPRTPAEETVARIWQQVLGLSRVGVHDKFFDIGGDSLKIVRVFRLLNEVYPDLLTVVDLFKHSTIEEVAAALDGASPQAAETPELQGFEL